MQQKQIHWNAKFEIGNMEDNLMHGAKNFDNDFKKLTSHLNGTEPLFELSTCVSQLKCVCNPLSFLPRQR